MLTTLARDLFSPSATSGRALRLNLNTAFAASFEHILEACAPHVEFDSDAAAELIRRMRAGSRETPFLYALHFELLDAIESDDLVLVERHVAAILDLAPAANDMVTVSLDPETFPWDAPTVARYFADEEDSFFHYVGPASDLVAPRTRQLALARDIVRRGAPGVAGETDELVSTLILGAARQHDGEEPDDPFQGASALRAFGALMLDARENDSVVDAVSSLLHEEAHQVLFALDPMDGVVTNSDDERYSSPLRLDPRPLEGIHHATFVLARIVYGMRALQQAGVFEGEDARFAAETITEAEPLFFDGLATTRRHADMTLAGAAAMDAAERYMTGVASRVA